MGLAPVLSKSIWVTRGRLRKGMLMILGVEELPILLSSSSLAYLVLRAAHEEDHWGPKLTHWRSRSKALVVRRFSLAKRVERECQQCVIRKKTLIQQKMVDLPEERVGVTCSPFTYLSLDLMGRVEVRAMVKSRSKMKVCPLVIVSQSTEVVHTGVCHN